MEEAYWDCIFFFRKQSNEMHCTVKFLFVLDVNSIVWIAVDSLLVLSPA